MTIDEFHQRMQQDQTLDAYKRLTEHDDVEALRNQGANNMRVWTAWFDAGR